MIISCFSINSRAGSTYHASKKSSLPVIGWWNRRPLKVRNDSKLILDSQGSISDLFSHSEPLEVFNFTNKWLGLGDNFLEVHTICFRVSRNQKTDYEKENLDNSELTMYVLLSSFQVIKFVKSCYNVTRLKTHIWIWQHYL